MENPESTRHLTDTVNASTRTEFIASIRTNQPRDFILAHDRIISYADTYYDQHHEEYKPTFNTFTIPQELENWKVNLTITERPKSLFLCSPSRFGKTEWARSLGCHMYFNNMINLDDWNPKADYIIFDDIDWKFMPNKKAFFEVKSSSF